MWFPEEQFGGVWRWYESLCSLPQYQSWVCVFCIFSHPWIWKIKRRGHEDQNQFHLCVRLFLPVYQAEIKCVSLSPNPFPFFFFLSVLQLCLKIKKYVRKNYFPLDCKKLSLDYWYLSSLLPHVKVKQQKYPDS